MKKDRTRNAPTTSNDMDEALRRVQGRPAPTGKPGASMAVTPNAIRRPRPNVKPQSELQQFMGRILTRTPITETTRITYGTIALMTGSTVRWAARSSLVEINIESFNAPQMVASGSINTDGTLWITSVRPVLAEEWAGAIADLIVSRYDLPSDDPQTEEVRRRKISDMVLSMAVPLGLSPRQARQKAKDRLRSSVEPQAVAA